MELIENGTISASLIFDIGLILIVLIFVVINAKRGFSRIFISVVGYVFAIILGCVAGDAGAEPIYNSVLKNNNISEIQKVLEKTDVSKAIRDGIKEDTYGVVISEGNLEKFISMPDRIYSIINGDDGSEMLSSDEIFQSIASSIEDSLGESLRSVIPNSAVDYMMNSITSSSNILYETASILVTSDTKEAAEYLEETFIKPIVVYIVKMAIFFIVFFIVMIVVKLIAKSIENNNNSPSIFGITDRLLGTLLGIVEAAIVLIVVSIVLKWLITSNVSSSSILNDEVIQSTKIFKYIYELDTLKILE